MIIQGLFHLRPRARQFIGGLRHPPIRCLINIRGRGYNPNVVLSVHSIQVSLKLRNIKYSSKNVGLFLGSLEEVLHRKRLKTFAVTHLTKYFLRSGVMESSNDNVSSLFLTTETSVNHKQRQVKTTKRLQKVIFHLITSHQCMLAWLLF